MNNVEKKRKEILSLIIENEMESGFNLLDHYDDPINDLIYMVNMDYLDPSVLIETSTGYVVSLGGPHCVTDEGRNWVGED